MAEKVVPLSAPKPHQFIRIPPWLFVLCSSEGIVRDERIKLTGIPPRALPCISRFVQWFYYTVTWYRCFRRSSGPSHQQTVFIMSPRSRVSYHWQVHATRGP